MSLPSDRINGLSSNPLNGLSVYRAKPTHLASKLYKDALYIPLPPEAWAPIPGGCQCSCCRLPDGSPGEAYWDTLLIAVRDHETFTFTTTVHMPEAHPARGSLGLPAWLERA